jgi:hypothetical protein
MGRSTVTNVTILTDAKRAGGYPTHEWATYRQWQELGQQVRKGERGTRIYAWRADTDQATGTTGRPRPVMVKSVFNRAQVDPMPEGAGDDDPDGGQRAPQGAPSSSEGQGIAYMAGRAISRLFGARAARDAGPRLVVDNTAAPVAPAAPMPKPRVRIKADGSIVPVDAAPVAPAEISAPVVPDLPDFTDAVDSLPAEEPRTVRPVVLQRTEGRRGQVKELVQIGDAIETFSSAPLTVNGITITPKWPWSTWYRSWVRQTWKHEPSRLDAYGRAREYVRWLMQSRDWTEDQAREHIERTQGWQAA